MGFNRYDFLTEFKNPTWDKAAFHEDLVRKLSLVRNLTHDVIQEYVGNKFIELIPEKVESSVVRYWFNFSDQEGPTEVDDQCIKIERRYNYLDHTRCVGRLLLNIHAHVGGEHINVSITLIPQEPGKRFYQFRTFPTCLPRFDELWDDESWEKNTKLVRDALANPDIVEFITSVVGVGLL